MELTVLGASGSYPTAHSACSGYLVTADGYHLWMDAGNGTLSALQRHIDYRDVDAVVLSHAHPDHCADIYPFFFALLFAELGRAIPVLTPSGVRSRLEHLIGEDSRARFRSMLDWQELAPGARYEAGPFVLDTFDAAHSIANNTVRLTADGATLCYSGDTGPNEHLAVAAREADLFLCEASWIESQRGLMEPIHLTAGEAGSAAREAGAKRLMLTHLWADNDRDVVMSEASESFEGDIVLAESMGTVKV